MKDFPFQETDRESALKLPIGEVLFSGGTYQIEIIDEGESFWPFIQIDDEGSLKDGFCTCERAEKYQSCPHLAASYLQIFAGKKEPLHVRFRASLWNHLCQLAGRRHGYETSCIKKVAPDHFECHSLTDKVLFTLKTKSEKGQKQMEEILFNRVLETEETSLKFSNLAPEELKLWQEGRPSEHLRYELSFWSDMAKLMMRAEDLKAAYEIRFKGEGLPRHILIAFPDWEFDFYIAEANWPELIPTLSTTKTPLIVSEFEEVVIRAITYDEEKKELHIESKPAEKAESKETLIEVGDYHFSPGVGFFSKAVDPLLKQEIIPREQIQKLLTHHAPLLRKYLSLSLDKHKASYTLYIDSEGDLHIHLYLFDPTDKVHDYGPFVYVKGRGFYAVEERLFEEAETVIRREDVGDFVTKHRLWLAEFENFQTHLLGIESHMIFHVDAHGDLHFEREAGFLNGSDGMIDYGEWIYIRGRGFYAKIGMENRPLIKPGTTVSADEVGSYITAHRDELEQIENFFADNCPIEKCGVEIKLLDEEKIAIEPKVAYTPDYVDKKARFYGSYVYVPGEGFAEVPSHMILPESYQKPFVVDHDALAYFIHSDLAALRPYLLAIDPKLEEPARIRLKVLDIARSRGEGEWQLEMIYQTNVGKVDIYPIWEALSAQRSFLFTDGGLLVLTSPRFNWLRGVQKRRFSRDRKKLRLSTLEWIRLSAFETIEKPLDPKALKLLDEIGAVMTKKTPDITGLKSTLRSYQEVGVQWLWSLYNHGLSALLCDEMGLGKTHQAMALIRALLNRKPDAKILVVCPTSVIYHWEQLLHDFLPDVRTLVYYGTTRSREGFSENHDLLLTSYGTLRSEKTSFSDIKFELTVFDELQTAKNKQSQTHKVLRRIKSKMRLGLTGTPIENRLTELKALFDLVLPSFLPSDALYQELFVIPIEKNHDREKSELLTRLITPFILRRKKSEVLLELPEKIEEISYCDLSYEQKTLYRTVCQKNRDQLLEDMQDSSKPVPYLHVFSLLTHLKQICDHPAVYTKDLTIAFEQESGKWDLFVELLSEAIDSGQKVVVFSQYLDMLTLIETYLKNQNISYAAIRGSTRDRKAQMDKFQNEPDCMVFVGSLQAAGTGIDLIAGSIVIHYDRWWNPAKEEQATARVHRMGQKRGVQVFKLVTKNTIEEHIHELIERKKGLQKIVAFDDQDSLKTLDRAELMALLQRLG